MKISTKTVIVQRGGMLPDNDAVWFMAGGDTARYFIGIDLGFVPTRHERRRQIRLQARARKTRRGF